jgi:hypothetical protein
MHSANPVYHVATFGADTGTGNLCRHLFTTHLEQWVTFCNQQGIPITTKGAAELVHKFRKEPDTTLLESEHPTYSKKAFIDAIVEWIVGDDQVCVTFYFVVMLLNLELVN